MMVGDAPDMTRTALTIVVETARMMMMILVRRSICASDIKPSPGGPLVLSDRSYLGREGVGLGPQQPLRLSGIEDRSHRAELMISEWL